MDCKKMLADGINGSLEGFRERRRELAERPEYLREVVEDGAKRASVIARATLEEGAGEDGAEGRGLVSEIPLSASGKTAEQVAREAIGKASRTLVRGFRGQKEVHFKGRGNVVTESDYRAESRILEHLQKGVSRVFDSFGGEGGGGGELGVDVDSGPAGREPELRVGEPAFCGESWAGL